MDLKELRHDHIINDWLDNINAAKNTERNYLQAMRQYTDFTELTPERLLTEAEEEIKAGVLMRQRKIKSYIVGFRKYLQQNGIADGTIKTRLTGVRSFYESFDIELPKVQGERKKARRIEENQTVPTKEDLQECLKVCTPLEKAVMLSGISSGLASNEVRHLLIKDFKKGYDPETEICTLKLVREKVNFEFVTFLSPEATRAIKEYLEFRNREVKTGAKKRIAQLEKQRITSDNGYLFILQNITDEYLKTRNEELRHIPESGMIRLYRGISEKAKKNTGKGYYNFIRSHTMRKYFNSALLNAGCDSFSCEFWMGHTLDETRAAYFRASPEKMREIYKKYIPYLIIEKSLDVAESKEYRDVLRENDILRAQAIRATVENAEIMKLRADIEEIRSLDRNKEALLKLLLESPEAVELMKKIEK